MPLVPLPAILIEPSVRAALLEACDKRRWSGRRDHAMFALAIQSGLRSFPGLAHRMETIARKGRVLFVNDSKATNADSAAKALACFSDIFWIAGGKPKTGGISSLAGFFPRIRKAYLVGEAAAGFAAELEAKVPFEIAGSLDRAVALAARDAEAAAEMAPVVLLSPACASFDQFRNFEVRGHKFRELIRASR